MAVSTIDTTLGSASANAYCSLAVANQYHDDRAKAGDTTWTKASNTLRQEGILWATKLLDALVEWNGVVVDDVQKLMWPRYGLRKRNGYEQLSSEIPIELQEACAEYSRQLIADDLAADRDAEVEGLESLRAGPVTLKFRETVSSKSVPDAVIYLLPENWYGRIQGVATSVVEIQRA